MFSTGQARLPCYTRIHMQLLIDIALSLIYFLAFLLVCAWAWRFWKMYVNQKYLNKTNNEYVMLEILLPREIFKSPYATEVAIASLLQGGGMGNWFVRNFKGNLPMYSSLEIASIEGVIHFYVRTQKKFRPLIESNFYAQYPGIEIIEADDYTNRIRYHHLSKDVSAWGATYKLGAPWKPMNWGKGETYKDKEKDYEMPADFLPIKTYVGYGLEKDPKEEFKIDPLTPLLEMMGSIGKGEHMWYQILVSDEKVYDGKKMPKFYVNEKDHHKHMSLSDMADEYKKITRSSITKKGEVAKNEYGEVKKKPIKDKEGKVIGEVDQTYAENKISPKGEMAMTAEEKRKIEAVNAKLGKPLALAVIRLMYIAEKNSFRPDNIQNVLSFAKPFAGDVNSLAPKIVTDPYNYAWENWQNRRVPWRTEEMFEEYVEREGFYPHIPERKGLDKFEDSFFWSSSMKTRKIWRMLFEGIFHPFTHPQAEAPTTLNLEEIATIWHLPGAVATTPTLPRIDSAKGVAPVNIPQ